MDNIMECVTKEVDMGTSKNIVVNCTYGKPGSCVDTYKEKLSELINSNGIKQVIICRDFQTDLLNPKEHN